MGKGDKKTRRGKIVMGTYGVRRKRKKVAAYVAPEPKPEKKATTTKAKTEKPAAKKAAPKKTTTKKTAAKAAKK